ncbi:sugar-binding protein [Persicobacter diffluens]|uniref:Fibronectin type-III domain-containing protein n=1 Tax=Persicobacter diffluens TaxID=981 RepID=A0AAN4W4D5_9BACT|nr:hypothetical protein PEDI_49800 [Persicobacter diffluens]
MIRDNKFVAILLCFFSLCFAASPHHVRAQQTSEVAVTIDWDSSIGEITNHHWGVNDFKVDNFTKADPEYNEYLKRVNPGIIRIHKQGMIGTWSDSNTKQWRKDHIKTCMENATKGYPAGTKVLLNFSDWPDFISPQSKYVAPENHEKLIQYFLQLPHIMKELGFRIDYYEFFNENENYYQGTDQKHEIIDLTGEICRRFKAEFATMDLDYTPKVGGPALTWPNHEWYQPTLDRIGQDLDFFSWHNYGRGPQEDNTTEEQRDLEIFRTVEDITSAVNRLRSYAESKGLYHLEYFLDEFNVQWVWNPYEKRHHNNVGAVWFSTIIKRLAENGVDGAMCWNAKDGAYGLMLNDNALSAPGQLYLWGGRYLVGDMAEVSTSNADIEAMAVTREGGKRSVLIFNRSHDEYVVTNANSLLATNGGVLASRMDASTQSGQRNNPEAVSIGNDHQITLPSFSVVLVTEEEIDPAVPVTNLSTEIVMDNGAYFEWEDNGYSKGFNVYVNGIQVAKTTSTNIWLQDLDPATAYTMEVSALSEFEQESSKVSAQFTTLSRGLKINDHTEGSGTHLFDYSEGWMKMQEESAYNGDLTTTSGTEASVSLTFEGDAIAISMAVNPQSEELKVSIDGLEETIVVNQNATNVKGDFGVVYMKTGLTAGTHSLQLETDGTPMFLDYVTVFGAQFAADTEAPSAVEVSQEVTTHSSIQLKFTPASDNTGVEGYQLKLNGEAQQEVFSPYITFSDLEEESSYEIEVIAYDVAGNTSSPATFTYQTKKYVETLVHPDVDGGKPEIDGQIDEIWNLQPRYKLVQGEGNTQAYYSLMWDRNYLYLLAKVTKTQVATDQDAVHVFIDTKNEKLGNYGSKDFFFDFNRLTKNYEEQYNNGSARHELVDVDDHYVLEASFKWSSIGGPRTATAGDEFGFGLHIKDHSQWLMWEEGTEDAGINTKLLANMTLTDEEAPEQVTSIGEAVQLNIFPNPATTSINIQSLVQVNQYSIIGMNGQSIAHGALQGNAATIDIAHLPQGIYLLEVSTLSGVIIKRFIKQ